MALTLRYAARSDIGLVRSNNQDSAYAGPHLLVVADGMGGHAGGDVASSIAIGALAGLDGEAHGADALGHLQHAVEQAQRELLARVADQPELAGMGTTVTALLRTGRRFVLAHIGDSRAYLLRDGRLAQVTSDHTFVQRLVDDGRITAEEAERHPQRSVLLRVLGDVESDPDLDTSVREAVAGDRWLLCSDGLSGIVSDATLEQALAEVSDPGRCADQLVQLALRGGGPDNITVVVADVVDDASGPVTPQVVGSAATDRARASSAASSPAARAAELSRSAPTQPIRAGGPGGPDGPDEGDGGGAPAAGRAPSRRPRRRTLLAAVLAVVVLAGGALAASAWLERQYFVGAQDGRVTIFSGLPQDVGPLRLSTLVSQEDLLVSDLPAVYQERVEATYSARDLADAERIVGVLRTEAASAAALPDPDATTAPTTDPSASATTGPTTDPSAGATTAAPTPTAAAS